MSSQEPIVRATMLSGLEDLLQARYQLDTSTLLAEAGLALPVAPGPEQGVSLYAYARLLDLAAKRAGDDSLGLQFARAFPRGGTQALGFLVLNAPDLRTSLACLSNYVRLQSEGIDLDFTESDGIARLAVSLEPTFPAPRQQLIEFVCALIVLRLTTEFGDDWKPLQADFEHRAPEHVDEHVAVFGKGIRFNQPQTVISVRSEVLRLQSEKSDERLFALLKEVAEGELARRSRPTGIVAQVGQHIARTLPLRAATLESTAAAVDRTPRQLQNDLKRAGTTFEKELATARRSLAERYLRDSDLAMSEIASQLGFSDLSAFTRAAKGWLGLPPSQWRQQARRAGLR